MTLAEIKELISKKIAGQGSQVDIGGALAEVLTGIAEAVEAATPKELEIASVSSFSNYTKAQAAEALGITEAEVDALYSGEYSTVVYSPETLISSYYISIKVLGSSSASIQYGEMGGEYYCGLLFKLADGSYSLTNFEA